MPRAILLLFAALPALAADRVAILHKWANSLGIYDSDTGRKLAEIPVGLKPHEFAFSPDRNTAWVTHYGINTYTQKEEGGNTIGIVDLTAGKMIGEIGLGQYRRPHGIERGSSGKLYVTTEIPAAIHTLDPVSHRVLRTIETAEALPHMLVVNREESRAWTANCGAGSVTAVDLNAGKVIAHVKVGGVPMGIALSGDGRTVYAGNRDGNAVFAIDAQTNRVMKSVTVQGSPARLMLTPNGKWLIVSLIDAGEAAILTLPDLRQVARFRAGSRAEGMGIDPSGKFGYISAQGDDKVVKFRIPDWEPVQEIRTASRPDPIFVLR